MVLGRLDPARELPLVVAALGGLLFLLRLSGSQASQAAFQAIALGGAAASIGFVIPAWAFHHSNDAMFCSFVFSFLLAPICGYGLLLAVGGAAWYSYRRTPVSLPVCVLELVLLLGLAAGAEVLFAGWTVHPGDAARDRAEEEDHRRILENAHLTLSTRPEGLGIRLRGEDLGPAPLLGVPWTKVLQPGPVLGQRCPLELRTTEGRLVWSGALVPGWFLRRDDVELVVCLRPGPPASPPAGEVEKGFDRILAAARDRFRALRPKGTEEQEEWEGPVPAWLPRAAGARLRVVPSWVKYEVTLFDGRDHSVSPPPDCAPWLEAARRYAGELAEALVARYPQGGLVLARGNSPDGSTMGWKFLDAASGDGRVEITAAAWQEDGDCHRHLEITFEDSSSTSYPSIEPDATVAAVSPATPR